MSTTNYNQLVTTIIDYVKRKDANELIPTFIYQCENHIDKKLRVGADEQIKRAYLNTDDRYITLPQGFTAVRKVVIYANGQLYNLAYVAPNSLTIRNGSGLPRMYTIIGNTIEFECIPNAQYKIEINYFKKLTPLSETNLTNKVLEEFPNLYIYGTLYHLYVWARDEETAAWYKSQFDEIIQEANAEELTKRIGPTPAARYEGDIP